MFFSHWSFIRKTTYKAGINIGKQCISNNLTWLFISPQQDKRSLFMQELNPALNTNLTNLSSCHFLICHCYVRSMPDLSLFLLYLNCFSKDEGCFWKCVLQEMKCHVKLLFWNALIYNVYHFLVCYFSYVPFILHWKLF